MTIRTEQIGGDPLALIAVDGQSVMVNCRYIFVLTQIRNLILLFSVFAAGSQCGFAKPLRTLVYQDSLLGGWAENNDGRLRLVLTNNSPQQFRGTCRLSLGSDNDQKEIGQVMLTLPPQETTLLQLNNVLPSGQQYTLTIYDQKGVRRFLKIAPLHQISDPTPAQSVALTPVPQIRPSQAKPSTPLLPVNNSSLAAAAAASEIEEIIRAASQVQVQARLLTSEEAATFFILSFEFRSARPIKDARIAIVAGKVKENKLVSIYSQARVEFKLPEQLETEQISYTLTGKDGRALAKGELDLQQLMSDGVVIANDIRTDRSSYEPGESARITILLEGKSQHGFRLEVSAKDGQNQMFFRDQKIIGADDKADSQEFTISIPANASAPIFFEFKIFDSETGLLFDSGEREIPMNTKSPRHP
ncbi:MAG: hypothetical protein ABIU20_03955 [Blastocatellia bacterium]